MESADWMEAEFAAPSRNEANASPVSSGLKLKLPDEVRARRSWFDPMRYSTPNFSAW